MRPSLRLCLESRLGQNRCIEGVEAGCMGGSLCSGGDVLCFDVMAVFRRDDNLRISLVHTAEKQAATRAGTYPCQHPCCRTCGHISSKTDLLVPKDLLTINESPAVAALPFTSARLGAL